jgi:hypothetical protein
MADAMTTDFYNYFIDQEGLTTNNKIDEDYFNDKIHEHLDDFVSYEVDFYDVQKYVNKFGVFDAIQICIDNYGELQMFYLDSNERKINNIQMCRHLLYVILNEIVNQGYDDIYDMVKMNEKIIDDRKNEKIDYINEISQMIIGF